MQSALNVLAGVPDRFQRGIGARLKGVVSTPGGVVALFGHGLQLRLGNTSGLGVKLRIAAKVLSATAPRSGARSRTSTSAPARPAVGYKK